MKNITSKLLAIGLCVAVLTCGLTACKVDKKVNVNVNVNGEEVINTQLGVGAWEIAENTEINSAHKAIFAEAVGQLDGYDPTPVALLATQTVSGTNYCFLCTSNIIAQHAMNAMRLTYINVDAQGKASFLGDETLVLPGTDNPDPNMVGGWSYAESIEITDEVRSAFDKACETLTGATYEPVAYIGSQLVSGTNHAILCKV